MFTGLTDCNSHPISVHRKNTRVDQLNIGIYQGWGTLAFFMTYGLWLQEFLSQYAWLMNSGS